MAYNITKNKEESLEQLKRLVASFEKQYPICKTAQYSEAQLRNDFLNPLLKTFGWDVDNETSKSQFLRDVIQEEAIDVEEDDSTTKKNPDYTIRIQGIRKLFIEAKKVSIDIEKSNKASFQIRRYGWNANLGVSILTNFENIIVFDCRYKPSVKDNATIARYDTFHYKNFIKDFDKLYNLLSCQSISAGYIDEFFSLTEKHTTSFDNYFLAQIEKWRFQLATNIIQDNEGLNEEDINFLVQRLLNRIVFLRICEDREIEKHETLKAIKNYDELKALFAQSDRKYNSGLFDFIEDNFSLNITLKSEILIGIFAELYYPESPYDFAVVDPSILSQIYERYLGSKISIINSTEISIVEEPEVSASSGVVPTPKNIVKNIVKETLSPLLNDKSFSQIQSLKIIDICCGSGTFLISIYDFISEKIISTLINEGVDDREIIFQIFDGSSQLTLKAKQDFLLNNIFGVDINPYAVEVAKFSLFLKLLENENAASINEYLQKYEQKVLPSLDDNIKSGNSLVDEKYFEFNPSAIEDDNLLYKVKPFNWVEEFPFLNHTKGFDAIVGNPPYVRIQNMVKYLKEEVKYYQNDISEFTVAQSNTFDKYYLFIQKAISLLNANGIVGYIVPNKFFTIKGGKALRSFITTQSYLNKIIHFGVSQVFPNRSTYVAVLIIDKKEREQFKFKRIKNVATEFIASEINYIDYWNKSYSDKPWIFVSKETEAVFNKIKVATKLLKNIAEIPVGLQTSDDDTYIFTPIEETENTYKFNNLGEIYEVEKSICKPCLYNLSFGLFDKVNANAQMIFPYIIADGKAEIISEKHFGDNYPLAWKYLNTFKSSLSKRSINGSKEPKWYQFGRSQSLTKFHNAPKLIWPVLSTKSSYIYDKDNIQFTGGGNGPYYSLISNSDYSPLFILGILSHPVFECMVKAGASEFRGDYYSHGKQFIENIPIKEIDFTNKEQKAKHDTIASIVNQLIEAKYSFNTTYNGAKKGVLQRKLNILSKNLIERINELYNLSENDINVVLSDDMFLTDSNEN